jgi:hypothetical protein
MGRKKRNETQNPEGTNKESKKGGSQARMQIPMTLLERILWRNRESAKGLAHSKMLARSRMAPALRARANYS